ncbi:hypothetical protein MFRU_002g02730 [Monilinia fructicola]|nr:hypothetical protein MFRU_002g02730 [Monilinia fructicola]
MSSDNEFDVVSVGGKVVGVKSGKGGGKGGEGRGSKERLVGEGEGEVITVSESDDDNDDKEDSREKKKGIKVTKNLKYHPDLVAVRIIRAFRSVKIRQNKWRPVPHELTGDNIEIDACIANGAFGVVFRAENRDTRTKEKPGRKYAIKVTDFRLLTESKEIELSKNMGSDHSPTLTLSSEAQIMEEEEILRKSLYAKRTNEMKTSIRYIKEGHPNVCNMEGFGEFNILGNHYFMYVLELCDLGTLMDMVYLFRSRSEYIPEGFMWHAFEQLLDGLTFLHGEHPDYQNNEKSRGKDSAVILRDIKPNNVFLHSSHEKDTYPTVKLADFGEAIHLPIGGSRNFIFGNTVCDPPDDKMSAKYDVWSVGVEIYYLALNGTYPDKGCEMTKLKWPLYGDASPMMKKKMTEARNNPARFKTINNHLTLELYKTLRWVMTLDRHERPRAREAWRRVKEKNEERKKLMYRALPDWVTMIVDKDFAPLELVQLDFRIQQSEDEGLIFEHAGNIPRTRDKFERQHILDSLEKEKKDAQAMKDEKLRNFRERAGERRRVWILEGHKREREVEEIQKIEEERERFGGWLEPTVKKRRMGLGKFKL